MAIYGYAKRAIKAGETLASVEIGTGKVESTVIKFKPWGKEKLARYVLGGGKNDNREG